MARKRGLTRQDVVKAAVRIADQGGIEALNLLAVAERLGVRSPSLYHHLGGGLDQLRRAVALHGAARLATAIDRAIGDLHGEEALFAVAHAYRRFAHRHPGQLAAMLPAPRPGEDEELYAALAAPVARLVQVFTEIGIEGERAIHMIRALRSYLHGFVDLERRGGFGMPQQIDESFELGVTAFTGARDKERQP